eukprot:m.123642 g.123642  ORF g.123642 m.123642 type:complete len:54 (-) comp23394_c0_seq2:3502-3663(-)
MFVHEYKHSPVEQAYTHTATHRGQTPNTTLTIHIKIDNSLQNIFMCFSILFLH